MISDADYNRVMETLKRLEDQAHNAQQLPRESFVDSQPLLEFGKFMLGDFIVKDTREPI